ncbi:hypothetical protein [Cryptosporangium phraense]|uniref:MacB-like periplasmic core domain-containing protein n=1 Tax=Cryptosporangium phraense TaxID=2593070 RepID=A0A545AH67_9ACTN|nr:hypothetical protein [Cryptosporangium phraense]TQS40661.1 hypothetical protein FL583_33595 [Cryptosporangium phraense]
MIRLIARLTLRDAAADPYADTRAATAGPDVVAVGRATDLAGLAGADGVTGSVDRPEVLYGSWVRSGGVVVEGALADAFGVRVGDPGTVDGRSFPVVGVAVSAALPPYPAAYCLVHCGHGAADDLPADVLRNPGLIWLTRSDLQSLGADVYVDYLRLAIRTRRRDRARRRHADPAADRGLAARPARRGRAVGAGRRTDGGSVPAGRAARGGRRYGRAGRGRAAGRVPAGGRRRGGGRADARRRGGGAGRVRPPGRPAPHRC